MKVLFLDIDGVLNDGWTTHEKTPLNHLGVEDDLLCELAKIVNQYRFKIVLTSDWRLQHDEDYDYLCKRLAHWGLEIFDQTPRIDWTRRGYEISAWLKGRNDVEDYIVLDDNLFDFQRIRDVYDHVVLTNSIIDRCCASGTPTDLARSIGGSEEDVWK